MSANGTRSSRMLKMKFGGNVANTAWKNMTLGTVYSRTFEEKKLVCETRIDHNEQCNPNLNINHKASNVFYRKFLQYIWRKAHFIFEKSNLQKINSATAAANSVLFSNIYSTACLQVCHLFNDYSIICFWLML